MKINNIRINGFGKLKDKNIDLENGINLIFKTDKIIGISALIAINITTGVRIVKSKLLLKNISSSYLTTPPLGISLISINSNLPSWDAQRSIPADSTPRSLTGFKFSTTITFLPIISSGL